MKAVLERLKSYLGRFSEDRKPSNNQKNAHAQLDAAGYGGGYGFPLLIRRSKEEEKKLSKTAPSHHHSWLISSEPILSSSCRNKFSIESISSPASAAGRVKVSSRSTHLRDCFMEMDGSQRVATRTHSGDQPFDRFSSEYYSCGKKRAQRQRSPCEVLNVDCTCSVGTGSEYSSESGMEVSSPSCAEDNELTQVSKFSIILAENKALIDNCCHCIGEATLKFNTNDDSDDAAKAGANDKRSAGFCSQHEPDEEESSAALDLSPARDHVSGKEFPPPLTMLAYLQSYSPEAIAASHCLRSFRQDGRIVLQEVRAPIHKYFHVLREHGRLKLELISAADDSSQEEDERSTSDVCLGGESDTGRCRTDERMSAYKANIVGMVKPLEQAELAASDFQNRFKLDLEAENQSNNVGASTDERIIGGKLLFTSKVGAEDLASCFNEAETTTVYGVPSTARMKHNWVHQISAF